MWLGEAALVVTDGFRVYAVLSPGSLVGHILGLWVILRVALRAASSA